MKKDTLQIFVQAIVNRGKCNSTEAVLNDYDPYTDSFYYYKSDYELFKEILKLQALIK